MQWGICVDSGPLLSCLGPQNPYKWPALAAYVLLTLTLWVRGEWLLKDKPVSLK